MSAVPKPLVIRDPKYLAYLRTCPCAMTSFGGCNVYATIGKGPSEVSHLAGKSRDDRALPMCGGHHRTNLVSWHHGKETFCAHYGVLEDRLVYIAETLYGEWVLALRR